MGALGRVADARDRNFKINSKDIFIFSSRTIPGNEISVEKIINKLCVISPNLHFDVHVSGHPAKEDLKKLYKVFRPTDLVPIHGNKYFLLKQTELATTWNNKINTYILHNGDELTISHQIKSKKGKSTRPLLFSGRKNLLLGHQSLQEKKNLAYHGAIFIGIDKQHNVKVQGFGLPHPFTTRNLEEFILDNLRHTTSQINKLVENYCYKILGYVPVISIVRF
jgi:ribonuclease J